VTVIVTLVASLTVLMLGIRREKKRKTHMTVRPALLVAVLEASVAMTLDPGRAHDSRSLVGAPPRQRALVMPIAAA